jgi:hypothetical protein
MDVVNRHNSAPQSSPSAPVRRCADCRREFERHQEYVGSPRGIVCRNWRKCADRAPRRVNGRRAKLYANTISEPIRETSAPPNGGVAKLYGHTISNPVLGASR